MTPERDPEHRFVRIDEVAPAVLTRGGTISFVATGASMWPHIRDGDIITVQPFSGDAEPRVGWVVAYRTAPGRLAVHRVIGIERGSCLIRGDAWPGPPEMVGSKALLGRVVLLRRGRIEIDLTGARRTIEGRLIARTGSFRVRTARLLRRLLNTFRRR